MEKNIALGIINQQKKEEALTQRNTHFANISKYHDILGWWINIPFKKFQDDIYLLLNQDDNKKLILIHINANSIENPNKIFRDKDGRADIFIAKSDDNIYNDVQSNGIGYQFTNIEEYSSNVKRKYTEDELMFLADNVFKIYVDKYNKNQTLQYSIIQPSSNVQIIHSIAKKIDMSTGTAENYSERLFNLWNELNDFHIRNGLDECPKLLRKVGSKVFDKNKFRKNSLINLTSFNEDFEKNLSKSKQFSHTDRMERLKNSPKIPSTTDVITKQFNRNPYVITEVLDRANGICEQCNKPAPFIRANDNTPYLEVHHKKMLSDGGEDTVDNAIAVCPNCHRELHFGKDANVLKSITTI